MSGTERGMTEAHRKQLGKRLRKIADCPTSLDELIAAQGQAIESLMTHKKGLM